MMVRMSMDVVAMAVGMRMSCSRYCSTRRKRVRNPLEHAGQVKDTQENQHQSHGEFHGETDASWNNPAEQNDSASHQQDREGVAHAPQCTDHRSVADLSVPCDDGCNSDHMIGIGGMPHPEEEAERDDGE